MHIKSSGENLAVEDGIVQLAIDLSGSDAGYLLISKPEDGSAADEFHGEDHYVEVKDQLFGRYGGIEQLEVLGDQTIVVLLSTDVPGVGNELSIETANPMTAEFLGFLRQLERA